MLHVGLEKVNEKIIKPKNYSYREMEKDIKKLKIKYPFIGVDSFGSSILGKNLYYIRLGEGEHSVFYNAAHHANEWITALLVMSFAENYADAYANKKKIKHYDIPDMWKNFSIYIAPMVNPDGVDAVIGQFTGENPYEQYWLGEYKDVNWLAKEWKANIQGVDLNLNYPAEWKKEKEIEQNMGILELAPFDYCGVLPLSESETCSMANFTISHKFEMVISFHSQGEEIYWNFSNYHIPEAEKIAEYFAKVSGYELKSNPLEASYAGYKDWFIQQFRKPGFTIEVGKGENPLPLSQFNNIYKAIEEIMISAPLFMQKSCSCIFPPMR